MAAGIQKILIVRSSKFFKQRFHSRLIADNGNILWASEKYANIGACESTALPLAKKLNISVEYNYDRVKN